MFIDLNVYLASLKTSSIAFITMPGIGLHKLRVPVEVAHEFSKFIQEPLAIHGVLSLF